MSHEKRKCVYYGAIEYLIPSNSLFDICHQPLNVKQEQNRTMHVRSLNLINISDETVLFEVTPDDKFVPVKIFISYFHLHKLPAWWSTMFVWELQRNPRSHGVTHH